MMNSNVRPKALGLVYLALVIIFMYLPIAILMVLSFNEGKSMSSWQGFSLKWYQEMFQSGEIMTAMFNTLTIALWASIIATIVGVMACIALNAMNRRSRSLFMGLNNIPMLNADIVTGISIMMMFLLFGISLNYGTILFSHITFCIPYIILSVMPKFNQLENQIYEAALDLGATPVYAFFKVVLPDLMPGIVSGFLLSFTMSVDDFVITHFTKGAGINTLSTLIYSQLKIGVRPTLYALSTVIFISVLLVLVVVNIQSSSKAKKRAKDVYTVSRGLTPAKMAVCGLCIIALLGLSLGYTMKGSLSSDSKGKVYIYNFGDYIDPDLVDEFQEETGYTVVSDYFDTNEEMYPVISKNTTDYDVICASDYMINKLVSEDLLIELDYRALPNARYLQDNVAAFSEGFDPGMKHSIPHTWGTYGIIYDKKQIDPDTLAKLQSGQISWGILWDKRYDGQVIMPNSIREADMIAARLLGYSMNTTDEAELAEITDKLIEQKPMVYSYANDNARDLMISESAAMAVISSGDVLYAQEDNPDLDYVVPLEGSEVWTDCWAIPTSVKNVDGAHAWINFMYKKRSARKNFEYLTYAIPNTEIADMMDSPILNPPDDVLSRCETLKNLGHDADAMYSKYWKHFKDN